MNDLALPPHNTEAEQGTLAGVLTDNELINEVVDVITADDFYRDSHQVIFSTVLDLWNTGRPADLITVVEELQRRGRWDEIGREDYLAEIMGSVAHQANTLYYAGIVREKSVQRKLIDLGNKMLRDGYSQNFTADELVASAENGVLAIGQASVKTEAHSIGLLAGQALHALELRIDGAPPGTPTGLMDLDDIIGGLLPSKLYILAARPSMGKTALALSILDSVTADGAPGLFFSLEMDKASLTGRWMASRANVDATKYQRARGLSREDRDGLRRVAMEDAPRSGLVIDDAPGLNLSQIAARARRHKIRHGLKIVALDYLQLVDGQQQRGENREQEVARISRRMKHLAKELGVPVILLSQLNRAVEAREDKRPRMADLRESGQIEQDADVILLLHRPDYYNPDDKPGVAQVIVAKNRDGGTGTAEIAFIRHTQRFETLLPQGMGANPF